MTNDSSAPIERAGLTQVGGQPATVVGADLHPGERAPEFTAHTQEWQWLPAQPPRCPSSPSPRTLSFDPVSTPGGMAI